VYSILKKEGRVIPIGEFLLLKKIGKGELLWTSSIGLEISYSNSKWAKLWGGL